MNGHDEETYERKDLPPAFISREEHERILKEERVRIIDECIEEIERLNSDGMLYENTAVKVLESLKS